MVRKIHNDGADDTGETDVSELRARFSDGSYVPVAEPEMTDDDIEAVLLQMVDDGELCWGWIPERNEFGFWPCETNAWPCDPGNETRTPIHAEPVVEAAGAKHRRAKVPVMRRAAVTLAAVLAVPAVGVAVAQVSDTPMQHTLDAAMDAAMDSPDTSYVADKPTAKATSKHQSDAVPAGGVSAPVDAAPHTSVKPATVPEGTIPVDAGHSSPPADPAEQSQHAEVNEEETPDGGHIRAEERKKASGGKGRHRRTGDGEHRKEGHHGSGKHRGHGEHCGSDNDQRATEDTAPLGQPVQNGLRRVNVEALPVILGE